MLTAESGQVKVLDFGLAKFDAGGSGEAAELTNSPTLSLAATRAGTILGTAAYMSPEQAKGRTADKRSDVWGFGCILYEMLTGARAFEGEDLSDTLAAVLRAEPDQTKYPSGVPAHLRGIVARCLQKDRKARIPDIAVVRYLLDEAANATETPGPKGPGLRTDAGPKGSGPRTAILWKVAAALLLLTTIAGLGIAYRARSAAPVVTRFYVSPPEKTTFVTGSRPATSATISPDGKRIAFTARDAAGKVQLWVRSIDSLTARPLPGTDDAEFPFWSPDSRFIAYSASVQGKLLRIAASGGPPQTLCTIPTGLVASGAWSRDGVIVFSRGPNSPLFRVPAAGGQPVEVTKLPAGHLRHNYPSFLPDGRHLLFYVSAASEEASGIYVAPLDTGELTRLLGADTGGIYSPRTGHLLFVRQGTLMAQSFNPTTLTLADEPFPVAERVESAVYGGVVAFSMSDTGALTYGIGSSSAGLQMVWVDRKGKVSGTAGPQGNYRGLDLTLDGTRVAAHRHDGAGGDIWVTDLSRGTTSKITYDASQDNSSPIWSPDGNRIVFGSLRAGKWGLYQKPVNGAGSEERLIESDNAILPVSWSHDGRSIVYSVLDPKTARDLWMLPLTGDRKAVPLLQTPFGENNGQISPDGKWLAYYSNANGANEIYVQSFPTGTGKFQISTGGGVFPRWRADGRELFFMSALSGGKVMAVDVKSSGSTFEAGTPRELFDSGYVNFGHTGPYHTYAVSADGQHFLIPRLANVTEALDAPIAVVLNWAEGIKKN